MVVINESIKCSDDVEIGQCFCDLYLEEEYGLYLHKGLDVYDLLDIFVILQLYQHQSRNFLRVQLSDPECFLWYQDGWQMKNLHVYSMDTSYIIADPESQMVAIGSLTMFVAHANDFQ